MFYVVRYCVQIKDKLEYFNSLFIHSTYDTAVKEGLSKKFYGTYPVVDFYIDIFYLNKEV